MRSAATDRDRWSASSVLTIAMCCAMGLVSGTAYAFGGYERDLKFAIALSQTEVQALGIVIDVAMGGTQMLSGWIVDNFSSCVGAGVASLLVGAGYMTVALALWDTGDADAGATTAPSRYAQRQRRARPCVAMASPSRNRRSSSDRASSTSDSSGNEEDEKEDEKYEDEDEVGLSC